MAAGLHISISAETLFEIAGVPVTNSMLTSLIASALLIGFALAVHASYDENTTRPKGLQNFAEWLVEMLYNLVHSVTNSTKKTVQFLPFIGTFLLFITLNNWVGLLPGNGTIGVVHTSEESHAQVEVVQTALAQTDDHAEESTALETVQESVDDHIELEGENLDHPEGFDLDAPTEHEEAGSEDVHAAEEGSHEVFVPFFRAGTADLNMTLALAIFSQVMAQVFGFQALGAGYLKKFFNFSSPIMFFVGLLELMGEFTKVISYAFRLFGNIFAGEVLLVVIAYLVPIIVPMPFYGLEFFVGLIQGLVFAMLSLVFFNMATASHDEH